MRRIQQTIDTCEEDRDFVKEFEKQVDMLANMTVEIFTTGSQMLLSSSFRQIMADKGRTVSSMLAKLKGRLAADNPGEPFKLSG